MSQFYIYEIKQLPNGEFEDDRAWAYDEDPDKARLKGESIFYDKLSKASVSNYAKHSVILVSDEGFPVMNKCYKHDVQPESAEEVVLDEPVVTAKKARTK